MKITIIGNGAISVDEQGVGYVNRQTGTFLHALAFGGHKVSFVEPRETFDRGANLHDFALSADGVTSIAIDNRGPFRLFLNIQPALWNILLADFVYIFYPGTLSRAVATFCIAIGKPFGLYLRGERFTTTGSGGEIFRRAKFIITVSSALTQSVGLLNTHITPIRPMLDISGNDAFHRDFIRRLDKPWQLLFVGRLEDSKGVRELIKAAGILRIRGFQFSLALAGGGPLYGELAARHGNIIGAPIRVLGPVMDRTLLMAAYETADFFILPTHHEGFPRVLYEAMIKSMVIFTTFVGGIPGLMIDGGNCVRIPVDAPEAIANAIERASLNRLLMQRLSESGMETIMTVLRSYPTHLEAIKERLNV